MKSSAALARLAARRARIFITKCASMASRSTLSASSKRARSSPPRNSSALQLRENAGDIAHAPMLGDESVSNPEYIARGEAQRLASGLNAEIDALMPPLIDEARRRFVARGKACFDAHLEIGQSGEPGGEKREGRLLGRRPRRGRRRGAARLMIDVILGK